jgi:hypothetical protein
MTNEMKNWLELGLSADDEKFVRAAAEIYNATYVHTLDSVFKIAKAIDILQKRHFGSGVQGGFADALVQYGFTARDRESPMDKGIRSNLKELLADEQAVRDWWRSVPESKKRDWVSARAIYKHWKRAQKPSAEQASAKQAKPSPYEKLKADNADLVRHNIELKRQLETREDGDRFKPADTADDIATTLVGMFSVSKAGDIARRMLDKFKTRKAKATTEKPKKSRGKKATAVTEPPTTKKPPLEWTDTGNHSHARFGCDELYALSEVLQQDGTALVRVEFWPEDTLDKQLLATLPTMQEAKAFAEQHYAEPAPDC